MVTCDMESIYPNSTVLSASCRSVHLEYPSGGSLHASATTCASTSPVTLAGTGGVSRFFLLIVASSPFSQYELLTVCTVVGVVWYAFEISDTVMYVSLRLSEARRIFARNIVRAGLFPFVTMSVSFSLSSALSLITYFNDGIYWPPRFCWGHYNMASTIMQFLDLMDHYSRLQKIHKSSRGTRACSSFR